MLKGSCCCGAVQFELINQPSMLRTCHCARCRKVGASSIVFVKKEDLVWHAGKEKVATYKPEVPYKYERNFCKNCGTSLGEILSNFDSFPISAHAIDGELGLKNQMHEFVSEKPSWYEICDDAPRNSGHPS